MSWAEEYDLSHPVIADPGWGITTRYVTGGSIGLPSMHLFAPGAEILMTDAWVSEADLTAALE